MDEIMSWKLHMESIHLLKLLYSPAREDEETDCSQWLSHIHWAGQYLYRALFATLSGLIYPRANLGLNI
jgi:hypothetical protein